MLLYSFLINALFIKFSVNHTADEGAEDYNWNVSPEVESAPVIEPAVLLPGKRYFNTLVSLDFNTQ